MKTKKVDNVKEYKMNKNLQWIKVPNKDIKSLNTIDRKAIQWQTKSICIKNYTLCIPSNV